MSDYIVNTPQGPSWPPYRAIQAIEERVEASPIIDEQEKAELERDLDDIRQTLEAQSHTVDIFVRSQLKELGERVVTLYGKVDTCWTKSEVSRVRSEAKQLNDQLRQSPARRDFREIALEVDKLRRHINKLDGECGGEYLLHYTDRPALQVAKLHINWGIGILQGKNIAVPRFEEVEEKFYDAIDEEMITESTELFTIAELFYRKDPGAAREFHKNLSESRKKRFFLHMQQLEAPSLDLHDWNNSEVIAQALVATAYETAASSDEHQLYMSLEEISVLFAEAERVRTEQQAHQAQLSLIKG